MFYLGGTNFPTTRDQLARAVTEGMATLLTLPSGRSVVNLCGEYPRFDTVTIDLTGAKLTADRLPPEPKGTGQVQPGPSTARLEVAGHPLYVRESPVELSLGANDARFDYDRDVTGRLVLLLKDAKDGAVTLTARKQDLDALAMVAAREGATEHGVQILETQLTLTQLNPRSVAAEIRVKGKKMFVTATLHLRGTLTIDDALNAKISGLSITGQGMLGEMVSAAIRPKLNEVQGRVFPLTALSLGEVRLRDLRVEVGETMKLTAAFGS